MKISKLENIMHDWVLKNIAVLWNEKNLVLEFVTHKQLRTLFVNGFTKFAVTAENPWGESVCVNEGRGPVMLESGQYYLYIEMQSGDVYEIEAASMVFKTEPNEA